MLFIGLLRSVIVIGNYTYFFEKLARREQRRIAVIVVFFLFTGDKHIGIKKLFLGFYLHVSLERFTWGLAFLKMVQESGKEIVCYSVHQPIFLKFGYWMLRFAPHLKRTD